MLCQFTVKNFKSIRQDATFDLQAAAISEHEDRVIHAEDGEVFLPISAIYGPNGGGKSNVLEAMYSLIWKVLRPLYAAVSQDVYPLMRKKMTIEPFSLSKEGLETPTEFELFFRTNSTEYRYQLHVKRDIVLYERLDRIKLHTKRRSALFERTGDSVALKGVFAKWKISDELSATLPLLSYLGITYQKNDVVEDVLHWFQHGIYFLNYGNPAQEMRMAVTNSPDRKSLLLKMIQEMDLDIIDFRIEKQGTDKMEIFTKHCVDGYETELNLQMESSGTQKIWGLLPCIAESLLNGTTLFIDELDAKLHPLLLRYIIMLFNDMTVNKKGGQLIFTSHDLTTMTSEVFRRDEIWFVAKGKKQDSRLYSLVEFKNDKGESIRKDAKFDKQYLEGKYGADPYLKKLIDWGKAHG